MQRRVPARTLHRDTAVHLGDRDDGRRRRLRRGRGRGGRGRGRGRRRGHAVERAERLGLERHAAVGILEEIDHDAHRVERRRRAVVAEHHAQLVRRRGPTPLGDVERLGQRFDVDAAFRRRLRAHAALHFHHHVVVFLVDQQRLLARQRRAALVEKRHFDVVLVAVFEIAPVLHQRFRHRSVLGTKPHTSIRLYTHVRALIVIATTRQ